jgi:hypothetical protein
MNEANRKFMFTYHHNGVEWGFTINADDYEDAVARIKKLPMARYDGEIHLTIYVPKQTSWLFRPMANLICWWKNLSEDK